MSNIQENVKAEDEIPRALLYNLHVLSYGYYGNDSFVNKGTGVRVNKKVWMTMKFTVWLGNMRPRTFKKLQQMLGNRLKISLEDTQKLVKDILKVYDLPTPKIFLFTRSDSLNWKIDEKEDKWLFASKIPPFNVKYVNRMLEKKGSDLCIPKRIIEKVTYET